MDFRTGKELLRLCSENSAPISTIMLEREKSMTGNDETQRGYFRYAVFNAYSS